MRVMFSLPSTLWQSFFSRLAGRLGLDTAKKIIKRDPRFAVQGPMIYRRAGGLIWYDGEMDNISSTGALFRGEKAISADTPIEISFKFPRQTETESIIELYCWARIVRTIASAGSDGQPVLAAMIERYRTEPPVAQDIRAIVGELRGPVPGW